VHNFSYCVCFFSLHVSCDYVPIIRRNICIYATLCICYSVWMTVRYAGWIENLYTRQSSTQNNKYQVSQHRYSCFSWWWAHRPKHVEKRNKHTKKNCAPSWLYFEYYTGTNGKQIVKNQCCLYGIKYRQLSVASPWLLFIFTPAFPYAQFCAYQKNISCRSGDFVVPPLQSTDYMTRCNGTVSHSLLKH
jgi:hypothetical protein